MLKYPPNWQLKKAYLRQHSTLRKKTVTMITDEYEQGIESFTEYPVLNCEIQPITSEDLVWMQPGILNVGDARGWFKEYIQMKVCESDFLQSSLYLYDIAKIVVENSEAKLKVSGVDPCYPCYPYPTDNPTISRIDGCVFAAPATEFKVIETKPFKIEGSVIVATEIKYILSGNNGATWYWWNGSAWVISNQTYAQSITSTEISAHLLTLPFTSGTFKWKAFLHTDDGTDTPILKFISMTFGVKIAVDDEVIDHQNKRYHVEQVIDYYTKDSVLLKECYLKKVVGE